MVHYLQKVLYYNDGFVVKRISKYLSRNGAFVCVDNFSCHFIMTRVGGHSKACLPLTWTRFFRFCFAGFQFRFFHNDFFSWGYWNEKIASSPLSDTIRYSVSFMSLCLSVSVSYRFFSVSLFFCLYVFPVSLSFCLWSLSFLFCFFVFWVLAIKFFLFYYSFSSFVLLQ